MSTEKLRTSDESLRETGRVEIWRHYKGTLYVVLHIAVCFQTGKPIVIYKVLSAVADKKAPGFIWARPLSDWFELVCDPDYGYAGPRFTLAEDLM